MDAPLQSADLILNACAAIHGQAPQSSHVPSQRFDVFADLNAKLTRGTQHQTLDCPRLDIRALNQRYAKGGCLARTGLGETHNVPLTAEQSGYDPLLHWRRLFKTEVSEGREDIVPDTKGRKCF